LLLALVNSVLTENFVTKIVKVKQLTTRISHLEL
jgi:hypothetical protein